MTHHSDTPLQALISAYHPEIQDLVLQIRSIILHCVPAAQEKVNLGWRSINFRDSHVGYFCGIFPKDDQVDVAFEWGVLLPDPHGVLGGESVQVRYLRVKDSRELPVQPLEELLKAAVNLPGDRSARLHLLKSGARPIGS